MKGEFFILLFIFGSCLCPMEAVTGKQSSDPKVADATDLNLIDDLVNGGQSSDNPSRGSLDSTGNSTEVPASTTVPPPAPVASTQKKTESGEDCKCVKYYSCIVEEPVSTNSTGNATSGAGGDEGGQNIYGVVDIRQTELRNNLNATNGTEQEQQPLCENYFDICCPLHKIKEGGEETKPTTTTPSTNQGDHDGHKSCGHRNENGVGFKMTGATEGEAQFGEFPWTVALIQMETNEDNLSVHKYVGGGALLHPQVVLTVAHNVLGKNRSTLKVRVGEWDTQTNDEPYPSQDRGVQKVIIHEQFLLRTLYNDIALLILDDEVRFAPNVDTVCLPPLNNKKLTFDNQMCLSAGWGKDHFGAEGRYSEIMKKVSVPIVPKDKCQEELGKSEKLPKFRLDKSFLCAGGADSGQDTCKGDGGSPLVCSLPGKQHSHYVAVGLVSWGLGCGSTIYPGVYTDVQYFVPWILKQMDKEKMSTEFCSLQN